MYEINLLKPNTFSDFSRMLRRSPIPLRAIYISLAFTAIFCISALLFNALFLPNKRFIESRSSRENEVNDQILAVREERRATREKIDQLTDLKKEDFLWSEKLKDLGYAVPDGLWLLQIRIIDQQELSATVSRRQSGAGGVADETDSYNLFGDPIEKPKKYLYITGEIDLNMSRAPLSLLNRFIDNLVEHGSFSNDFEILDWRLLNSGQTTRVQPSVISRGRRPGYEKDKPERKAVGFELIMGIRINIDKLAGNDSGKAGTLKNILSNLKP